jgi:hypothetical protein
VELWAKVAVNVWTNPKCSAAGFYATVLYVSVLLWHRIAGADGRLSAGYVSVPYIARMWGGTVADERVADALKSCIAADLLRIEGDEVVIVGWEPEWGAPLTSTERSRRMRARERDHKGDGPTSPGNGVRPVGRYRQTDQTDRQTDQTSSSSVVGDASPETRAEVEDVDFRIVRTIQRYNEQLGQSRSVEAWGECVRRALDDGLTEGELRLVCWHAGGWRDDAKSKTRPSSLFRLSAKPPGRNVREHLEEAIQEWLAEKGAPCEWLTTS